MVPDWDSLKDALPFLLATAGLWARLEVALSRARDQSKSNEREIGKLEVKVEAQGLAGQAQAVQLARIEESLNSVGRTLERIDKKINEPRGR